MPYKLLSILLALLWVKPSLCLAANVNDPAARELFNKAFATVFGPQGSTMNYYVNIIGIYKTSGKVFIKGKKSMFTESKHDGYVDGVTAYVVDKKKHTVTLYKANSDKRDKYLSKFKFSAENYVYSKEETNQGTMLYIKALHAGLRGVREVRILLDKKTHYPKNLRVKVAIFWTTVKLTDFRSGGISDEIFKFHADRYKGYKIIDKRSED